MQRWLIALLSVLSLLGVSGNVLPRNTIVSLSLVQRYFPQVVRQLSAGRNSTAVGHPTATLSVIYVNSDGSKKVTLTIDRYATTSAAHSAYTLALQKSRIPGFKPVTVPRFGQQSFAGTVTRGHETHVGLGSLQGALIVGATIAGYSATRSTIANLTALARAESSLAKAALTL